MASMSEGKPGSIPYWEETPGEMRTKIRDLILGGHPVEAIKTYRAFHGIGLKDAKSAIECFIDTLIKPR